MKITETKHYNDNDEWMLAEDLPECDLMFAQIWINSFVNDLKNSCGRNYSKVLAVFRGLGMKFYYGKNDCREMTLHLVGKIKKEPEFGESINANIVEYSDKMLEHAQKFADANLKKQTNEELADFLGEHIRIHRELYEWGWLSNATDMFYPEYTELLKEYLREKETDEGKVNADFVVLTTPEKFSEASEEQRSFLRIAMEIENDEEMKNVFAGNAESVKQNIRPSLKQKIEAHWRKYRQVPGLYTGFPVGIEYYYEHLKEFFSSEKSAAEEYERMEEELRKKIALKEELEKKLQMDEYHKKLFEIYADFMLTKFHRRYAQIRTWEHVNEALQEMAERLNLTRVEIRNTLFRDLKEMLLTGRVDYEKAKERAKYNVVYVEEGIELQFLGQEAEKIERETEGKKIDRTIREIKWQEGCLGKAKGKVRIVRSPADMAKFQKGDILVAISTNPDIVPIMKKAAAIVTEQGGVTSHAAIVSRELNIPCVIGTRIATKVLEDGEEVEVDATKGMVRRI